MSIFSNYKINKLRKDVEGVYQARVEKLISNLEKIKGQELEAMFIAVAILNFRTAGFIETMNFLLFHPDSGVFRGDIGSLNEFKFRQMLRKMAIWFVYNRSKIISDSQFFRDKFLEPIFDISPDYAKPLFDTLTEMPDELKLLCFYRWCCLDIGHYDVHYDSMHENSPDCKRFTATSELAMKEAMSKLGDSHQN